MNTESRILLLEPIERTREVGALLAYRLKGKGDDRVRNKHGRLENVTTQYGCTRQMTRVSLYHGVCAGTVSKRVARSTVNTEDGTDFAWADFFDILRIQISNHVHVNPILHGERRLTSISLLCMRTNRGTLTFFPVRAWKINWPFFMLPW